jgi:hypothetical protein
MADNATTALVPREDPLAVQISRSALRQQIATAREFPRDMARAKATITQLATLDKDTAEECIYALTRTGQDGQKKVIRGPSIRFAEIIQACWGNNRVQALVVFVDRNDKVIEAEGVFHDLETNAAVSKRTRRSIRTRSGGIYSDDMITIVGNAACSIALRNAILGGVPKGVWREAYEHVEKIVAGDQKTLVERRGAAVKAFAHFGVDARQLCATLGVAGLEHITTDHLLTLTGMHTAIKSGEATVEEMFPGPSKEPPKAPTQADAEKPASAEQDRIANEVIDEAGAAPAAAAAAATDDDDPPIADPDTYIEQLEGSLAVATVDVATFEEAWGAHKDIHHRLPKQHQQQAEALHANYLRQATKNEASKKKAKQGKRPPSLPRDTLL